MSSIKFDRWWNKLRNRKVGDLFITIRRFTSNKFDYYYDAIGKTFQIQVTDTKKGFKGFPKDCILLIFEVVELVAFSRGKVWKAKLLDIIHIAGNNISDELKEYDTRIRPNWHIRKSEERCYQ